MTTIGELIGEQADELSRYALAVGDVHRIPLGEEERITPKGEDDFRNKYLIILGFNQYGDAIGGLVINSKINHNLPTTITDYYLPVSKEQMPFLQHNSFVNCSQLKTVRKEKFNSKTYRGHVNDSKLLQTIRETLIESPTANRQELKEYSII